MYRSNCRQFRVVLALVICFSFGLVLAAELEPVGEWKNNEGLHVKIVSEGDKYFLFNVEYQEKASELPILHKELVETDPLEDEKRRFRAVDWSVLYVIDLSGNLIIIDGLGPNEELKPVK